MPPDILGCGSNSLYTCCNASVGTDLSFLYTVYVSIHPFPPLSINVPKPFQRERERVTHIPCSSANKLQFCIIIGVNFDLKLDQVSCLFCNSLADNNKQQNLTKQFKVHIFYTRKHSQRRPHNSANKALQWEASLAPKISHMLCLHKTWPESVL